MTPFRLALVHHLTSSSDAPTRKVASRLLISLDTARLIAGIPSIYA